MDGALNPLHESDARNGGRRPETAFAATVAVAGLPRFLPGELLAAVNRLLAPSGTAAEIVAELTSVERRSNRARVWHRPKAPPRVGLSLGGIVLIVEGRDRPAFDAESLARLDFADWEDGPRAMARAHGQLRVFEAAPDLAAEFDHNHDRAAAVTAVAAAAAGLVPAPGAVWQSSGVALPAAALERAVPALMQGRAPVTLWVGMIETPGGVATRGLYPLLGAEVAVRAPGLGRDAAARLAFSVASEIVGSGRPPAEGAEIAAESTGQPRLRVRYSVGEGNADEDGGSVPAIVLEEPRRVGLPAPQPLAAGAA